MVFSRALTETEPSIELGRGIDKATHLHLNRDGQRVTYLRNVKPSLDWLFRGGLEFAWAEVVHVSTLDYPGTRPEGWRAEVISIRPDGSERTERCRLTKKEKSSQRLTVEDFSEPCESPAVEQVRAALDAKPSIPLKPCASAEQTVRSCVRAIQRIDFPTFSRCLGVSPPCASPPPDMLSHWSQKKCGNLGVRMALLRHLLFGQLGAGEPQGVSRRNSTEVRYRSKNGKHHSMFVKPQGCGFVLDPRIPR